MNLWRHFPAFLPAERCAELDELITAQAHRFVRVKTPLRLGPNYRTLRGEDVQRYLPELVDFGDRHVQPIVESVVGRPLHRCANPGRAIRVQVFDDLAHEFRWHFDTSAVDALITLRNSNASQTQIIPLAWSRAVRPVYYPLYWAPSLFSLLPRVAVASRPGDMLVLQGTDVLHRGVPTQANGDRTLLVFAYEDDRHRAKPWRERFNKFVNARYSG